MLAPPAPLRAMERARAVIAVKGTLLSCGLMLLALGCEPSPSRSDGPASIADESTPAPTAFQPSDSARAANFGDTPVFNGCSGILAGDRTIRVHWQAAQVAAGSASLDPTRPRYRIYTSPTARVHSFDSPAMTTPPGATSAILRGLPNGTPVYVVVRAVGASGAEDSNKNEWCATPNPVRYVRAGNSTPVRDGSTPERAFATLHEAARGAIASDGVNLYVAKGEFSERVFLFDGMSIFGGFDENFSVEDWTTSGAMTRVVAESESDLLVVAPGERPCGAYRLILDGASLGGRGVVADECELELGDVVVSKFKRKGILLRTELDPRSRLRATIHDTAVYENEGEGLAVEGLADVTLIDSDISRNQQEGVEIKPLTATSDDKGRIKVERCRIEENGDVGIDVKVAPLANDEFTGGIIRITVRDSIISRNADHGLSIDVPDGLDAECEIKIENNTIVANQRAGAQIACDATANFVASHNIVGGNGADGGILITGRSRTTVYWVHHSRFEGNAGAGIRARRKPAVLVRQCEFRENLQGAVASEGGWVDLVGCWITRNGSALTASRLAYSVIGPAEPEPSVAKVEGLSLCIDSEDLSDKGHPNERDEDGTRADAGAEGGRLARPLGAGKHRDSPDVAYLFAVTPLPGETVASGGSIRLSFCRTVDPWPVVTVRSNGRDEHALSVTDGRQIEWTAPSANPFAIEVLPSTSHGDGMQPWSLTLPYP